MKTILRIIQIITAILLLFLSIGMFVPEFSFITKFSIDNAQTKIREKLEQPESIVAWATGYQAAKLEENHEIKQKSENVVVPLKSEDNELITISNIEWLSENQLFIVLSAQRFEVEATVLLQPNNNPIELQFEHRIVPHGVFWKSVLLLQKSSIQQRIEDSITQHIINS